MLIHVNGCVRLASFSLITLLIQPKHCQTHMQTLATWMSKRRISRFARECERGGKYGYLIIFVFTHHPPSGPLIFYYLSI